MPSLQNPTLAIMSLERRKAIVEVARKHNVWLIEDSIYGQLLTEQPTLLAQLAPERTFHVGGLSKTVAAGVRAGWVSCPANFAPRVQTAHKMVTGGIPFMLAELAAEMVLSGEADTSATRCAARSPGANRSRARASPARFQLASPRAVPVAEAAGAVDFEHVQERRRRGRRAGRRRGRVQARPHEKIYHRVRVGFSAPPTRQDVQSGFSTIRRLIDHGNAGDDRYG